MFTSGMFHWHRLSIQDNVSIRKYIAMSKVRAETSPQCTGKTGGGGEGGGGGGEGGGEGGGGGGRGGVRGGGVPGDMKTVVGTLSVNSQIE